jgi:uncharacterized membrane-anchored protein YhcB (DUF1043 family)
MQKQHSKELKKTQDEYNQKQKAVEKQFRQRTQEELSQLTLARTQMQEHYESQINSLLQELSSQHQIYSTQHFTLKSKELKDKDMQIENLQ